ncbi:unnamed protein product [Fusarium venenatum]|uniref:Uncharacterized protein n=1 Tax=Fusarium venenatum TaxID=56646 RepID=A0A2L2TVC1_9HYPO|nr:uncharacterized protein FVRRES_08343 [Fusarium venenatum]CEI68266.1 unnamed protein product [Fusarium venenatum]
MSGQRQQLWHPWHATLDMPPMSVGVDGSDETNPARTPNIGHPSHPAIMVLVLSKVGFLSVKAEVL